MFCNVCGTENPESANFCAVCGASLARSDDHETTAILNVETGEAGAEVDVTLRAPEVLADAAVLVVKRGPNAGSKYVVTDRASIGRHPDSDFFLDDVTVSRRHAEVRREGDDFVVKDNGSLNGTYVDGERVEERVLTDGDEIRIGKYVIVFLRG